MINKMKKSTLFLALASLLAISACSPTTSSPTTGTTTLPTTETTSNPTTAPSVDKSVLDDPVEKGYIYKLGDQIHNFTFKDVYDNSYNFKGFFDTKKVVVLNFFASWCGPCAAEFPVMEESYKTYKESVEIIALSAEPSDTNSLLKSKFVDRHGITFPVGLDKIDLYSNFDGGGAVPVSVIIDRYGTICEVHVTSIPYLEEWNKLFEKYTADDYVQPEFEDDGGNTTTPSTPDDTPVKPDKEMPSSHEIESVINDSSYNFGYLDAEGDDKEYNWPWLISDEYAAIYPSNSGVHSSYSIIRSKFTVSDVMNNVLAFDYLVSTEKDYDVLYVLIDGVIATRLSGIQSEWDTCYAYVPLEVGEYELQLVYSKDSDSSVGDDIIYVKNMRFINVSEINENMYIQRPAAYNYDEATGKYKSYQNLVLNKNDNYYHIDNENGPLILADLTRNTRWSNEMTPFLLISEGDGTIDGKNYRDIITEYASCAVNNPTGLTPVTPDLKEALVAITNKYGDDASENQWQELCYFYSAYGPDAVEFPSPITGLTMKDAIKGTTEEKIEVSFDTILVPRGKYIEFIAPKTGAYKFTTDSYSGTFGSVYNEKYEVIEVSTDYTYDKITSAEPDMNVEMYAYLEAGKTYYFRVAFSFVEELGSFNAMISYVGETYEFLVLASDSTAFTTKDEEFDIDDPDAIISRNVPCEIDNDGYYRHVREDGTLGSYIYADLLAPSSMFFLGSNRISIATLVENEGAILEWYDEETLELIEIEDLTADFEKYIEITENSESTLIPVNEELAHLLQRIMDYYTFYGVEKSWMKLCFYYDYFGPSAN